MKITDSMLQMQSSSYAYTRSTQEHELEISVRTPNSSTASPNSNAEASTLVSLSSTALSSQQANDTMDPRLSLLIAVIEKLTGHKIKIINLSDVQGENNSTQAAQSTAPTSTTPSTEWSIHFSSTSVHEEVQQTSYQAKGNVTTADGRSISFDVGLMMQRYERTEISSSFDATNAPKSKDPLVLNLSTDQVRLTGNSVAFDLNSDGSKEKLATLASGSAYLVLDRNHNGKIDNGSELFGPSSGNGFSDLSQLDSDHNGWIDENDAAYSQLAVWNPGGTMESLANAGVGAIALQNSATPYTIKEGGKELGNVRATGVFLTESGEARTIQQVDMVV
ncbi:hypothetical protein [Uliginosibacterium gangwonense]|uniref:hypothetical protein n=1 Tax=Uliginosibacterium gangwonense TaxID=392736 RepID=UPI00037F7066|nr:hypothetical protein [Uliginosibacterium gangwonense]